MKSKQEAQAVWDVLPAGEKQRLQAWLDKPIESVPYIEAIKDEISTATPMIAEDNAYDVCWCGHFRYSHRPGCTKCPDDCQEFEKERA